MGENRTAIYQYINNYFNTIKKDNAWLFLTYYTAIEDGINCSRNRSRAYHNRLKTIKFYYDNLKVSWLIENPGRSWPQSETYKGLYKKFDMSFILKQITMFVK